MANGGVIFETLRHKILFSDWNGDPANSDIPPDGPVDLDELERTLPPLSSHPSPAATEIRIEKGIESPLDIFPSTAPVSEEDIW